VNIVSLWQFMKDSDDFHPIVWVLPYNFENEKLSSEKKPLMRKILEDGSISFDEWHGDFSLSDGDFDAVIFNHPYDRERPQALWFDCVNAVVPVTIYIPYGPVMAGGHKNMRLQFAQPTQIRATAVVARSEYERAMYGKHCPSGNSHVHVLGQPRFDHLLDSLEKPLPDSLKKEIAGRRTVLWNSHFSFTHNYSGSSNFSTFDILGPEIFTLAVTMRERLCLLWRPHPGLFPTIVRSGLLQPDDLPKLRQELTMIGIILDETPDHVAAFKASDAMLTDVGSFLLEFLVTGKPILALINPDGEPLNEEASQLVAHYACANTPLEIKNFLHQVVASTMNFVDFSHAQAEHLPMLDGHAGERVAQLILQLHRNEPLSEWYDVNPDMNLSAGIKKSTPDLQGSFSELTGELSPPSFPPVLGHLIRGLIDLRREKSRESAFKKKARRRINMVRTNFVEFIKLRPRLMSWARRLRG